ncbi:sulfite dehydrogenase (cytochrome) subunit SorA apoprotein [Cellulophaga algicola DSM 14237]|uniref:Sulfite dehydrogenase (Cytochrome) subunit SorA apoprotein n=1 Tax=Cellulophaga algicola (strain DSM 14237 / IC166 / ACAM 630) TaxID=688270 RepID=E6X486_CELAD|nr:sulfite oxidase [Cellulophaga algicola]ADV51469.1 sulfite dehydrogenase (cytochrome) subunit SorA apoprotein [Cellulophaga algicola DSM 14237]
MERRKFITRSSLATLTGILGIDIVFGNLLPEAYIPLAIQETDPFKLFNLDKDMLVLNDKPWNIEAQAHVLDDKVTPNSAMFIRNNGKIPEHIDFENWTLTLEGESVTTKKIFTLSELKSKFKHYTYQLTLECGGNGRSEFNPPAKGNQWTIGAVSSAKWTGIRLKDVLAEVGLKPNAVYIGYHAADTHLSGDPSKEPISRGVPLEKALQEETILAFKMNGEDIPLTHGYPLRLIAGGYPASASGKWLNRISVRNIVHDGEKMTGSSYKVPKNPVAPGTTVKEEDMRIIESMPVKSLVTYPKSGATLSINKQLTIRGHAWAGELNVSKVEYSIDFGSTWSSCALEKEVNRFAWQHFSAQIQFPQKGYYEVWAKATDSDGLSQPMLVPGWNPKGYLNNACHRIAVKVV